MPPPRSAPTRPPIPVRRPDFDFDASIPRHWADGNALMTHLFNGMNLVFPDGERFFIKAVRDRIDRVHDAELLAQVQGFVGQEGRHAHEHERYFEILRGQGYPIDPFLRRFRAFVAFMNRWLPAPLRLAMTAGAEHYTAVFGGAALRDEQLQRAHPTLRKLIVWHATEEIEHKAVAFDVLRATHPSHALRMAGFLLSTLALFGWSFVGTRMLLKHDRIGRAELRRCRALLRASAGEPFVRQARRRIFAYLRPSFHPAQLEDIAVAHRRLVEVGIEVQPV